MHTYPPIAACIFAAIAVGAACAPAPVACTENTDCAFGQVCSGDGACVLVGTGAVVERRRAVGDQADDVGGQTDDVGGQADDGGRQAGDVGATDDARGTEDVRVVTGTGRFEGSIGGTPVDDAHFHIEQSSSGTYGSFLKPGAQSTFLLIRSTDDLMTPGRRTIRTGLDGEVAQACNFDSTAYDEFFPSFDVEVSPPRDVTVGDPTIGEASTVVDVTIAVVGEGSDVSVTFTLPTM